MDEIHFILGNDCNFNCDFCFWERRTPTPNWKSIKHIVDEIIKTGIRKITITGGEPTISPFFLKTLKYCQKNSLETIVHSNGSKINKSLAKKMAPLINRVSLSLDGSTENMAINMRKNKLIKHNLALIDYFNKLNTPVCIKTLVTKINQKDIKNIGNLLKNKPILYWSLLEFNPIGRGLINQKKFSIPTKDFESLTKETIKKNPQILIKIIYLKSKPKKYCFITTEEEVFIDTKNEDILIGNLKEHSLAEIFKKIQ